MKRTILLTLLSAAAAFAQTYTKDGQLLMPKDYRSWTFLTSNVAMTYPPAADPDHIMFGNVFANPKAVEGFSKTGVWPDKTVLLIENRAASTGPGLGKDSKFQTEIHGYEIHVKDASRGGWNFYFITEGSPSGKPFAKDAACFTCHAKSAAVDTTFVQYYPTLIEIAKKHGTYKSGTE